jgi:hypothetical protein
MIPSNQVAHIKTRNGARTSLLVPEVGLFLIAAKESGDQKTACWFIKLDLQFKKELDNQARHGSVMLFIGTPNYRKVEAVFRRPEEDCVILNK